MSKGKNKNPLSSGTDKVEKNPPWLLIILAIITLFGTITAAYFSYRGAVVPTELIISKTETAQAKVTEIFTPYHIITPLPTVTTTPIPLSPTDTNMYQILIDTYHGGNFFKGLQTVVLQEKGFEFTNTSSPLNSAMLSDFDILIIDFAFYTDGKGSFTNDEIVAIKNYINRGGRVLLNGVGWVWILYGHAPIEEYPLNLIAKDYGCEYLDDNVWNVVSNTSPVFNSNFMSSNHPITKNVIRLADPGTVPGSIRVTSPAIPIIWGDNDTVGAERKVNPVTLAISNIGNGKIVCSSIGNYIVNQSNDFDSSQLRENILLWLTEN
jgi:hypothetical protein